MLKNVVEDIVDSMIDRMIEEEHACHCERCRMDVCAIALNNLKPKYIVTEQGGVFETINCYKRQNSIEVYTAILRGIEMVRIHPRHF